MNEQKNNELSSVNITNRNKIEVVGVKEVLSSTDREITAKLENDFIHIAGGELSIVKLSPEEKLLVATGEIISFEFQKKINKKSFLGKVFK